MLKSVAFFVFSDGIPSVAVIAKTATTVLRILRSLLLVFIRNFFEQFFIFQSLPNDRLCLDRFDESYLALLVFGYSSLCHHGSNHKLHTNNLS